MVRWHKINFYPEQGKVMEVAKNSFQDYDYAMQNHTFKFISQKKKLEVIFNS